MRNAFGLPQALMIILVVGGIATLTMKYASINVQHYADSYTREQAELFMQSATEATLLRLGAYNRSDGTCLGDLNITSSDHKFTAAITIERYYLADAASCSNVAFESIQTEESHGMISMKMVVESNATHPKILHPIRLTRRSLQRP